MAVARSQPAESSPWWAAIRSTASATSPQEASCAATSGTGSARSRSTSPAGTDACNDSSGNSMRAAPSRRVDQPAATRSAAGSRAGSPPGTTNRRDWWCSSGTTSAPVASPVGLASGGGTDSDAAPPVTAAQSAAEVSARAKRPGSRSTVHAATPSTERVRSSTATCPPLPATTATATGTGDSLANSTTTPGPPATAAQVVATTSPPATRSRVSSTGAGPGRTWRAARSAAGSYQRSSPPIHQPTRTGRSSRWTDAASSTTARKPSSVPTRVPSGGTAVCAGARRDRSRSRRPMLSRPRGGPGGP